MPDVPYYLIHAVANDKGMFGSISLWRTMELNCDSRVPLMGGGCIAIIEVEEPPGTYAPFPAIMAVVHGELELHRMLNKIAELGELDDERARDWVDSPMIALDQEAVTEA